MYKTRKTPVLHREEKKKVFSDRIDSTSTKRGLYVIWFMNENMMQTNWVKV